MRRLYVGANVSRCEADAVIDTDADQASDAVL
jgi:hypothetical protein